MESKYTRDLVKPFLFNSQRSDERVSVNLLYKTSPPIIFVSQSIQNLFFSSLNVEYFQMWMLEVPKNESQWVTNVRKSIVQAFDQYLQNILEEVSS